MVILEENGLEQLTPFIEDILQVLMMSITKYRKKNHVIVYDAIGTLADAVSTELNKHVRSFFCCKCIGQLLCIGTCRKTCTITIGEMGVIEGR